MQRPPRSGKELWKIAKNLVKRESKINLAANILRLNRQIKLMKLKEEKEKLAAERYQKEKKNQMKNLYKVYSESEENP